MFVGLLQSRSQTWKITERDLLMICDRGFYTNSDLQEHKNIHTRACPFKCSRYSMSFPYCTDLIAHKKTHVPWWKQLGNPFQCEECGKIIAYQTFLSQHIKSHTGENHFICGVCGKAMTSKESLKSHWLIHTGEKLIFLFCGRAFNKRWNFCVQYYMHTNTHTHTQRQDLCGKFFTQSSVLIVHKHYLMAQKPHDCEICSKGFVSRHFLNTPHKTSGMYWV